MTADQRAQFIEAWRRQSDLMFDNVGICVRRSALPSTQKLEKARRRLYGTHWLSRWWHSKIYPHVYPRKHQAMAFDVWELEELQRIEYTSAVLKQAQAAGYIE